MLSHAVGRAPRASLASAFRRVHSASVCRGHGSHVSDNDPETLEAEKQKNLKGEQKSPHKEVPGWNEKLASDSEATVKAERHVHDHTTVEELQKHTVEHLHGDKQ